MSRHNKTEPPDLGLSRIALQAMALLLVLPSLGVFYFFRDNLTGEKVPALICLLVAASLGYFLLWRVIRGVMKMLAGLERVSTGEAKTVALDGEVAQLKEMAAIINALNRLTEDFRENAAQLENLIQQFSTLAELTEITAHVPDITELLRLVLRKAMASTHARIGSVSLLREDGAGLDLVAAEGWVPKVEGPVPLERSLAKAVLESGKPMLVEDIEKSPLTRRPNNFQRYSTNSFLIMPLKTKTATIGAVSLSDKATGGPFHGQDQQFLMVLLGHMGYAVENARLLKQARDAANNLRKTIRIQESQLQEAQLKILQSEKLSALGQLAGGVAHDFNNLLQAILGYASLSLVESQHNPTLTHNLNQIRMAAERAASLTAKLLAFGRRQMLKTKNLDVNRVIEEVMRMIERVIGEHIHLEVIQGSRGVVHADPQQIEQALVNLCVNARDAMPDGGTMTISTKDLQIVSMAQDLYPGVPAGRYVLMAVKDQGFGMERGTLQRIFEPFFTTKEVGKGTGLGLSTVYGIVSQHNGFVDVKSEPGRGTEFNILLPVVEDGSAEVLFPPQPAAGRDTAVSLGGETILVAEDEALIRELSAEVLRSAGYEVLVAADGKEAIDSFMHHADRISVVLVDVIMPRKSGREVFEQVRAVDPRMPVLFWSGYSAVDLSSLQTEGNNVRVLYKPIAPDDLLREVREAIDGRT